MALLMKIRDEVFARKPVQMTPLQRRGVVVSSITALVTFLIGVFFSRSPLFHHRRQLPFRCLPLPNFYPDYLCQANIFSGDDDADPSLGDLHLVVLLHNIPSAPW